MSNDISVHHEWDPLREAIIGIGDDMVIYSYYDGISFVGEPAISFMKQWGGHKLGDIDPDTQRIIPEEIAGAEKLLNERGIVTHRCHLLNDEQKAYLADEYKGHNLLFPRDPILVIGNTIIELSIRQPMRRKERWAIRHVIQSVLKEKKGQYIAMPPASPGLDEIGPFLEGGDVLLNGTEIYVGHSGRASNRAGIDWLRDFLGKPYHITEVPLSPDFLHLDCALSLLRPGLGLICESAFREQLPASLQGWEFIQVTEEEAHRLGTNVLILDENTVMVPARHRRIIGELKQRGHEVIETPFSRIASYGGAFRCWHHPFIREGSL